MKVVILGKGEMLANLIEGALNANCKIAGVLRYERTIYPVWKLKLTDFFKSSPELTIIKNNSIHEIECSSANSEAFKKELIRLNADILLVGTWHEKIKKEILDTPVIASINVHPSLLPKYRGPNPYLQTILNGETKSGITFHLMDKNFDTGAILLQKEIQILPAETSKELKRKTVFQAKLLCTELLNKLQQELIVPIPQNPQNASYFPNIKEEDMMLDFTKETAEKIHSRIRAFHPWLPCYVTYKNKFYIPNPYKLEILDNIKNTQASAGEIIEFKKSTMTVMCLNGKALKMDVKAYGFFNRILQYIKN